MYDLDAKQIFDNTASDNVFVWLTPKTKNGAAMGSPHPHPTTTATDLNNNNNNKINSIEVPDPEMAYALYQAGHSTYCRAPPAVEELLISALLENTGLGCGQYDSTGQSMTSLGRGEMETFISATPGSVTGFHTDFQENFTIQLSGRKKWTLQHGTVQHVLRGVTPHYAVSAVEGQIKAGRLNSEDESFNFGPPTVGENAIGPVDSVILEPGDVLYFPAGMWHQIEVLEPGVSINCSLMATNYATLVCQSLQHVLLKRPEWRASICRPVPAASSTTKSTTVTQTLENLLEGLPEIIKEWTTRQGAAQGMLPPVLQHGDAGEDDCDDEDGDHESENWQDVNDDGGSIDREKEKKRKRAQDDSVEMLSIDPDDQSDEEDEDDDDPIVSLETEPPSIAAFDPSPSALQAKCKTHRLVRNPLALLIDEKDVLKHYQTKNGSASDGRVYILNVNYAGNETHESHLRIRIHFEGAKLDKMSPDTLTTKYLETKPSILAWLLYLGYLVWTPKNLN